MSFAVWFTGLPASGKSTVAGLVHDQLDSQVLEGEEFRKVMGNLGFSLADRMVNTRRLAYVANLLTANSVITLVAAITPHEAMREQARQMIEAPLVIVHCDASLTVCEARDQKGLYATARRAQIQDVTGVDQDYEAPADPEVHLDTERETPQVSAAKVMDHLRLRRLI